MKFQTTIDGKKAENEKVKTRDELDSRIFGRREAVKSDWNH
jgi:hypothetical protein